MDPLVGKKIILFDGVCNLCNGAVQWIIRRDSLDTFRFASLQSAVGQELTRARQIDTGQVDSIILIDPGVAFYIKSDAALEIARGLKGYRLLPFLFGWIPKSIRDAMYDLVARNRYRLFGKKQECMVPTPELKARFLDGSS
jgi:predicted DCC family thiol-disulfide oxidoreductase YuxK